MCRLSLLNKEGIEYVEKNLGGIENLFNHLENSFGGHGNGVCIIKNDGTKMLKKGVKLSNKQIAKLVKSNLKDVKWVMYHTRLASMGNITDINCHPFKNAEKVMMMNGTESQFAGRIKGNMTDTEHIFIANGHIKANMFDRVKELKSVFVGYENGKVFITKGQGSLNLLKYGKAIVFASEFPSEYYSKTNIFESPLTWKEGQKIVMKNLFPIVEVKAKYSRGYSFNNSNYGYEDFYNEYYRGRNVL